MLSFHYNALSAALSVFLLTTASAAAAQDAANTALARSLFEDGIAYTEAGAWEEAADRFGRSLALHPSAVVSFNAGIALTHLGRLVEAREHFRAAAASDNAQLAEAARARVEELTPRVGSLEIQLDGAVPQDARVFLDGAALPPQAIGVTIPIDPASHTLRVVSRERTLAERTVVVAEGGAEHVTLTLAPTPESVAERSGAGQADLPAEAFGGDLQGGGDDTLLIAALVGAGVLVTAIVVVVLVLALPSRLPPVEGNLGPGYVEIGQ